MQRRRRTLEALKRVLLRESQVQPLLLVCEDLHWIDSETQAALDMLVESLPTVRVLLLVNYRPEYQHSWASKTSYTQLRLDPLPEASADTLLQALLGNDPSLVPLTQLLIARSRAIRSCWRRVCGPWWRPGCWAVTVAPIVWLNRSIPCACRRRCRRSWPPASTACPEEKRLLQTAAVIGTEVPVPLLHTIAARPEDALHRGLAGLQAAEFLYETSLFLSPPYLQARPDA